MADVADVADVAADEGEPGEDDKSSSNQSSKRRVEEVLESLDDIKSLLEDLVSHQIAIKNLLDERLPKQQKTEPQESSSGYEPSS